MSWVMLMQELEEYYKAVVDCWRMFRRYQVPQKSQKYWQELLDETRRIYDLYGKNVFVKELIFVMLDEIDRRYEEIKGGLRDGKL